MHSTRSTTAARLLAASIATLGLVSATSAQQTINYDFNNTGGNGLTNFTAAFTNNGPSAGTNTYFGTGGVGNTGYVNNSGTQPSLVYNTAIATTGIVFFNTSVFLRTGTVAAAPGSSFVHLGFADALGANLRSDEALSNFFALRFVGATAAGELSWNTRTATPAGSAANAVVAGATNFTLASATWYKFDATFTKGATDIWNFAASVTPFGTDGLVEGLVLSSATGSFIAQSGTYSASTLYGAVMYRAGQGPQLASMDNYSIVTAIPEPSSFAALAGLGALGLVGLRRCRRVS